MSYSIETRHKIYLTEEKKKQHLKHKAELINYVPKFPNLM